MMIIYRPHMGSLKEAMAKCLIFDGPDEMIREVSKGLKGKLGPAAITDVFIGSEPPVNDERIGWEDTRTVKYTEITGVTDDGEELIEEVYIAGYCATTFPVLVRQGRAGYPIYDQMLYVLSGEIAHEE